MDQSSAPYEEDEETLRGVGERVDGNIGEELGSLPASLVYLIMIPTMMLSHCLFIGISSRPVDRNSPMYHLMAKKWPESGKPIIKTRTFLTICDKCRRRGIKNCNHNPPDPWSNAGQNRKVKILMEDRPDVYQREMRNEEVEDASGPAYNYDSVQLLMDSKYDFGGNEPQDYVYIAIDTAAGGAHSKYAIVSFFTPRVYDKTLKIYRERVVVIGCDVCNARQYKTAYNLVELHMRKLRSIPALNNTLFVIMPENNLAFEADHLSDFIQAQITHGYYICSQDENRRGFKTDNLLKKAMTNAFSRELDDHNVRFHNKFFTLTTPEGELVDPSIKECDSMDSVQLHISKNKPLYMVYREAADNMRDEVVFQLQNYTRIIRPSKDELRDATEIYSGKLNCPRGDDIATMLGFGNTMHKYFLTNERHKPVHRHRKTT